MRLPDEIIKKYPGYMARFKAIKPYVIYPEDFGEVLELSIIRDDAPEEIKLIHRNLCMDVGRRIPNDDFIWDENYSRKDKNGKLYGLKYDPEKEPYMYEQGLIYKELFDRGLFNPTPEEIAFNQHLEEICLMRRKQKAKERKKNGKGK